MVSYVWTVRDVKTKGTFLLTSVRSGVHVLVVLANVKGLRKWQGEYLK